MNCPECGKKHIKKETALKCYPRATGRNEKMDKYLESFKESFTEQVAQRLGLRIKELPEGWSRVIIRR